MRHGLVGFFTRSLTLTVSSLAFIAPVFSSSNAQALKPEHIAQSLERTIQIGGDLKQWDGLPKYNVELSNGYPSVPVSNKGYFSVAWDSKNLYILGVFNQAKDTVLAKLKSDAPEWWNDDVLELFIRTEPFAKVPKELHFAINPVGERFKAYTSTTEYQTFGRIEERRWVLELAIPVGTSLFPKIEDGTVWGLKVGREHQKAAEYPMWPMGGDFNAATNYGLLSFGKTLQEPQALYDRLVTSSSVASAPINSRLSDIGSYATYYGKDAKSIADLSLFDLAIVQPQLSKAQLENLHKAGTRVIAYLSIGELDPKSPLVKKVPAAWILGENKIWGSKYIDASQEGWQKLMLEQQAKLIKAGYDGVFLDTLDTVDLFPQIRAGLVGIVEKMRKAYPEHLIVQNRGFALLNQTSELIDAVMFENFSSWYNFDKKQYESLSGDPSSVMSYHERGLVVLCMDYANPDQTDLITRDFTRAKQFGFIPYVATILLDKLFIANP
jgi:uncharacterized protein (TIGR01370 family)